MKKVFVFAMMFGIVSIYAQDNIKPKVEKKGDITSVTYFHDNGTVEQEGTFNANGDLHGVWTSYDNQGNKLVVGNYENGKKVGKWFFWKGDILKEVDYSNSKIINVNQWSNTSKVAVRN